LIKKKHFAFYIPLSLDLCSFLRMSLAIPHFTPQAKHALLSIADDEDRIDTILFLLQTTVDDCAPIHCADVRSALLMVETRLHLLDGIE
jgi:hypothetical protein